MGNLDQMPDAVKSYHLINAYRKYTKNEIYSNFMFNTPLFEQVYKPSKVKSDIDEYFSSNSTKEIIENEVNKALKKDKTESPSCAEAEKPAEEEECTAQYSGSPSPTTYSEEDKKILHLIALEMHKTSGIDTENTEKEKELFEKYKNMQEESPKKFAMLYQAKMASTNKTTVKKAKLYASLKTNDSLKKGQKVLMRKYAEA